jgi:hypothetical protein
MKKLIFFFALALLSFGVNAQANLKNLQSDQGVHKAGLDTVSNAGSISQILQIGGYQDLITIQAGVTKLTGTPGGSVKLYGSVDNIKYDFATTATDTLAVGNVTPLQVKTWVIAPSKFQYYKAVYKGAGSQTSTIVTTAMWRNK